MTVKTISTAQYCISKCVKNQIADRYTDRQTDRQTLVLTADAMAVDASCRC